MITSLKQIFWIMRLKVIILWLMIEDHEIKSDDFVVYDYKLETDIEDHEIEIDNLGIDDYKLESDIEDHEIKMIIL